jgi:putative transposase
MAKRDLVTLTEDERASLLALTKQGKIAARQLTRAHMLLQADAGEMDAVIATALHVGMATVERVRKRCVEEGLEAALNERPRPGGQRKLNGKQEAFLIALACSTPPEGRTSWTRPFLAHTLVERRAIDAISDATVRRTRKKTSSRRGSKRPGVFRA